MWRVPISWCPGGATHLSVDRYHRWIKEGKLSPWTMNRDQGAHTLSVTVKPTCLKLTGALRLRNIRWQERVTQPHPVTFWWRRKQTAKTCKGMKKIHVFNSLRWTKIPTSYDAWRHNECHALIRPSWHESVALLTAKSFLPHGNDYQTSPFPVL